jgi:hypothetical protein
MKCRVIDISNWPDTGKVVTQAPGRSGVLTMALPLYNRKIQHNFM